MIPDTEKPHNDVVDMIFEGCQYLEDITQIDGTTKKELIINPKKVWWKTQIINSPTFSRFAKTLEQLEDKAGQSFFHMTKERAKVLSAQIMDLVEAYQYAVDAKSSECLRDKHNTQSTLIDKVNRNKIEKQFTVKEDAKDSFIQGLIHKESQQN